MLQVTAALTYVLDIAKPAIIRADGVRFFAGLMVSMRDPTLVRLCEEAISSLAWGDDDCHAATVAVRQVALRLRLSSWGLTPPAQRSGCILM